MMHMTMETMEKKAITKRKGDQIFGEEECIPPPEKILATPMHTIITDNEQTLTLRTVST